MNAISEGNTFRSASGSLYGTFVVNHIAGDNVIFSRESDMFDVWQLSKRTLDKKLADGLLSIVEDNT